jgi:hypothetical protein
MGGKTVRHKGDGLTVKQRCRRFILAQLKEGATLIPHAHGNGALESQQQEFSTNDPEAQRVHDVRVAEEANENTKQGMVH